MWGGVVKEISSSSLLAQLLSVRVEERLLAIVPVFLVGGVENCQPNNGLEFAVGIGDGAQSHGRTVGRWANVS